MKVNAMPDGDPELKKMLTQAMKTPRNFAMTVKGKQIALFLSKKSIKPPMIKEMKARVGATKAFEGVCQKADGGFNFRSLEAIPDTAAVLLKKHVKEETGLTIKPVLLQVDSLVAVDDDGPDFSDVEGASPDIDVEGRMRQELDSQVARLQDFVANFDTKQEELKQQLAAVKAQRTDLQKATKSAVASKKAAQANGAADLAPFDARIAAAKKLEDEIFDVFRQAGEDVKAIVKLKAQYEGDLDGYNKAPNFQAKYDLLQTGRQGGIDNVNRKMEEVFAKTERKLAILGRTVDTFEKDDSWLSTHAGQEGRVLNEGDWSMAVNDAFVKAGLNQKAEFAMITKFKDSVLAKIKTLLMNPAGKTVIELKAELRAFIKAEADPALFTGGRHNDGFAVSMVELEQLIDDGYVMMEHDPDGSTDETDKGKDWTGKQQVMVPSGKGQKIKSELADAAEAHEARMVVQRERKRVTELFRDVLGNPVNKTIISKSSGAKASLGRIKAAMDEERFDAAEAELTRLQEALSKAV